MQQVCSSCYNNNEREKLRNLIYIINEFLFFKNAKLINVGINIHICAYKLHINISIFPAFVDL